jgi:glucose/arabinose dehydrogenase
LLQLEDNSLLLTTGDGFEYREAAQDPRSQLGKIVRFNPDGSIPDDNPFADGKNADPYVYTLGHRSPQGLAIDTETGTIYMHEHGPQGGDEVNIVVPGANYGWPVTSYGINYSGARISPFETRDGITPPIKYWIPSIAPSGLAVYRGDQFPAWQGNLLVGALVDKEIRMLSVEDAQVVNETVLFAEVEQRVRDVRVGPDGLPYFITETKEHNGGKLYKVLPASDD